MAAGDSRIEFGGAVTHNELAPFLAGVDVLAVPSVWLETGPLVIHEAQACGLPVLGSDLGGIAELIEDGVNGLLRPPGDVAAWRDAIVQLATDTGLLARLADGVRSTRTMSDVAREMRALYESLLGTPRAALGDARVDRWSASPSRNEAGVRAGAHERSV